MTNSTLHPDQWLGNFGLDNFRPGQQLVIEAILSGRDTLCIMPTGGGKSLCYQLPSIARDGVTIVISPLIALMKDQVDSLTANDIPATFINSTLTQDDQQARIAGMINGRYKLVYIAPERLRSSSFMRAVKKTSVQLLAVDEAHCISQWGHDFRPDYARLGKFRQRLGNPQTVALTATATSFVQDDIAKILELESPARFVTGFARTNLSMKVQSPKANTDKDQRLIKFLNEKKGCGIIYASTRKNCEHLVELLADQIDRTIAFYHAGLPTESRRKVQEDFMTSEIEIIVATNAFGMGIDKADLRFVVHYNLPGSIEAYYQEAGRAGRDGKPSECLMLYSFQDKFIQEFFIENSYPSKDAVREVYNYLCSIPKDPIEMTLQEVKDELGLQIGTTGIATCENLLEKAGAIERLDSRQNSAGIRIDSELPTLVDFLPREATTRRHVMKGLEKLVGDLRGERVMFQPKWLADTLDLKWESVNRAIREITKLPMVNYISPFRGRAIHVVDRRKRFSELEIDFAELAKRQRAEHEKLESVIRFATTRRCRQLEILEYFGDPDRKRCGNCDNCGSRPIGKIAQESFGDPMACLYAVQVALSGAARTHGRFGKTVIAQMLTGSTSKKMQQLGLNRISTFGLLKSLRQSDVTALMDFLIEQGYIDQVETTKFRPTTTISAAGKQLLSGDIYQDMTTRLPIPLVTKISASLRGKRPHLVESALLESKQPAEPSLQLTATTDTVFSPGDSTSQQEPETRNEKQAEQQTEEQVEGRLTSQPDPLDDSLFDTSGNLFSESSASHGSEIGVAMEDQATSRSAAMIAPAMPVKNPPVHDPSTTLETPPLDSALQPTTLSSIETGLPSPQTIQPAYFWTWRLFSVAGYLVEHVVQSRQIDVPTVYDHLMQAMENGYSADPGWLLSPEKTAQIRDFLSQHPKNRASGLISKLPDHLAARELLFFAKCEPTD